MVYYCGSRPEEKREEWRAFLRTADRYLASANENLENYHEVSEYLAKHSIECAFKAVLSKYGKLTEDLRKGEKGHNLLLLKQRIIEDKCLPKSVFDVKTRRLIERVSHIDHPSPQSPNEEPLIDCVTSQISKTRYPINGYSPDEYVNKEDARKTLEDCCELIHILKSAISIQNL